MDEEVQIMGDSQDQIPEEVYKSLVKEWLEEIMSCDAERFIRTEGPLPRKEIRQTAQDAGGDPLKLLVALGGLNDALKGKGLKDFLPDDVSRRHTDDKSEETKSFVQRLAQKALAERSGGRSR